MPRLYGVGWDGGYHAHPDEAWVAEVATLLLRWPEEPGALLDADTSPMNIRRREVRDAGRRYTYGTLMPFALKGVSSAAARVTGRPELAAYEGVYRVARPLAALADLVTVLAIYLLGRRLFGVRVGLLAAAFAALTGVLAQHSHFYVAEPLMTMLLTAALLQVVRALQDGNGRAVAWAGLLLGAAVGVKPSAALFVPPALLILFVGGVVTARADRWMGTVRGLKLAFAAGTLSLVAWGLSEPYAVLDIRTYLEQVDYESRIQRGIIDAPYTRQYVGTIPGWYHLNQYVRWGAGVPLGLAAVAGLLWGIYRLPRRDWRAATLLAWIAPYTTSILLLEAKWLRYTIPITPALVLLAAAMLWRWHDRLAVSSPSGPLGRLTSRLASLAMAAILAGSALWVLAWISLYGRPHNWVAASRWIHGTVPAGSTIACEAPWDTCLPYSLPNLDRDRYKYYGVNMYDDLEPHARLAQIREELLSADYIALASNRISDTVPKLPWRYAVATRYYELLFAGRLGFREVARFDDGPSLGPLRIPTEGADDNVVVYDHPPVRIFRKERDLAQAELEALFAEALAAPWSPVRHRPR